MENLGKDWIFIKFKLLGIGLFSIIFLFKLWYSFILGLKLVFLGFRLLFVVCIDKLR